MGESRDVPAILRYFEENRAHFEATDPPKPPGFHTETFWQDRVEKALTEFQLDRSARFLVFDRFDDRRLIGTANFSEIVRGPFQACYLGYGLAASEEGKGLMTEALRLGIDYAFKSMNLHRIMANHLTDNDRSARVLSRLGFRVEGRAEKYLFINGQWRDHVLNSLTNHDWREDAWQR